MTKYHEIIIKGDEAKVRPFLRGYFAGVGVSEGFYFGRDCSFHRHFLIELLKYKGEVVHLVFDEKLKPTVDAAISQVKNYEFEVKESREVKRAVFHFDFETANREIGEKIKKALKRLPADTELIDFESQEDEHPDAKATEGYAPLHHYQLRGRGKVEGDVGGVVAMRKRFVKNTCFRVDDIYIVTH
jgi:hypothetical protein